MNHSLDSKPTPQETAVNSDKNPMTGEVTGPSREPTDPVYLN